MPIEWTGDDGWSYRATRVVEYGEVGSGDFGIIVRCRHAKYASTSFWEAWWNDGHADSLRGHFKLDDSSARVFTTSRRHADIHNVLDQHERAQQHRLDRMNYAASELPPLPSPHDPFA